MAGLRKSRHLALIGAALLAVGFGSGSALGQEAFGGNINSCTDLGNEYADASALVTVTANDSTYLSYTSTEPVVLAIKGGDNYYVYPAATEGLDLHAPLNGGENVPQISHYFFCYIPGTGDPGAGGNGDQTGTGDENGGQPGSDDGNTSGDDGQLGDDPTDPGGSDQGQGADQNDGTSDDGQVVDPGTNPGESDDSGDGSEDDGGSGDDVTDGVTDVGNGSVSDPSDDPATDDEVDDGTSVDVGSGSDGTTDDGSTNAPQTGDEGSSPSGDYETSGGTGDTITTLPITGTGSGESYGMEELVLTLAALIAAAGVGMRRNQQA